MSAYIALTPLSRFGKADLANKLLAHQQTEAARQQLSELHAANRIDAARIARQKGWL